MIPLYVLLVSSIIPPASPRRNKLLMFMLRPVPSPQRDAA